MNKRLPTSLTVELLTHMSEEGRFEQTLNDFPDFKLTEIRETFAWLAEHIKSYNGVEGRQQQKIIREFTRSPHISDDVKRVLNELPPEEG